MGDQPWLVRITADGAGGVLVGAGGRGGRGAYCCPKVSCLEQALRRRALPRALRCELPRLNADELRRRFAAAERAMHASSMGLP